MMDWPPKLTRIQRLDGRMEGFVYKAWFETKWKFTSLRFKTSEKLLDLAVLAEPHLKSTEEVTYELLKMSLPNATEEELRKRAKEFTAELEARERNGHDCT